MGDRGWRFPPEGDGGTHLPARHAFIQGFVAAMHLGSLKNNVKPSLSPRQAFVTHVGAVDAEKGTTKNDKRDYSPW